jgi:hypothetical protein
LAVGTNVGEIEEMVALVRDIREVFGCYSEESDTIAAFVGAMKLNLWR